MLNFVGLEGVEVGAAGLLRGIVHDGLQGTAGEGGTGNHVHAGAIGFEHLGDHDVIGKVAHMSGFNGGNFLDTREGGFGEGDLHGDVSVVAICCGLILTSGKSQGSVCCGSNFSAGSKFKRFGSGFLYGVACQGSA